MTCLESIIHQVGVTRLIFGRTGDDSMRSLYRPRDQIPNRQAEQYSHPSHHTIPVQTIAAAPGRMIHLYSGHSFSQHPLQPVMYQNQYQNSNLYHHRPLVQNNNHIVHTNFSPNEHYHNGMTHYHAGAKGILNSIPTLPFHLRNFHFNSGQHEPIPKDNAVLDEDENIGTAT